MWGRRMGGETEMKRMELLRWLGTGQWERWGGGQTGVKKTELLRRAGQHAAGVFLKVCERGKGFAAPFLCSMQRIQSPPSQNLTTPYNYPNTPPPTSTLKPAPRGRTLAMRMLSASDRPKPWKSQIHTHCSTPCCIILTVCSNV